jgi:hypothetical protein
MNSSVTPQPPSFYNRWQRFSSAMLRGFHAYANWLVGISWKRFALLALALIIAANILQDLPPFTWRITQQVEVPSRPERPAHPVKPKPPAQPSSTQASKPLIATDKPIRYEITIDERGVRIQPSKATLPASAPSSGAVSATDSPDARPDLPSISIDLPRGTNSDEVKKAVEEALHDVSEATREAAADAADAVRDAKEAGSAVRHSTTVIRLGDFLLNLALLWVLSSAVIKITYKGRILAEARADQATETAEAESLKRQVIEARLAAMQAQVEPHFLFNTLASIDHLIETDPPRASQMQKNLIALLRASMPTMREANAGGVRDLGRELAVIKPYLEILKVRMEERLRTEIDVPHGLLSAEFPPMMIQSLVENAIKHGLEPKPEGGSLKIKAEILHGKLAITVADTGLGFGRAATAGTGVGLANIRERLMLLYGNKASVTVTENQPSGTVVTISVPYRSRSEA